MLGAIFGDIAGSVYEFRNTHNYHFTLLCKDSQPTDDSYMTLAVAKALMDTYGMDDETIKKALVKEMQRIGHLHPDAGYGGRFYYWLQAEQPEPYNSFGNGSGMRVSAAGWMYDTLEETLHAAELSACVTHNHPEGIKGAQAIASAIFLARTKHTKEEIKAYIAETFDYDLNRTLDEIRPTYAFYEICQKSVPEAIIAFLEGNDYEDVIRRAIALGGDSDTIAAMAGGIAEAYYGMPETFKEEALKRLPEDVKDIAIHFETYRK